MNMVHYNSESDEWATPPTLYDKLNNVFCFTLDPCATTENAKCRRYYTKEQNGLVRSWAKNRVFMNPPYGREIGKWVKKAYEESGDGGAWIVGLIPARPDTTYWHEYIFSGAYMVCFLRGRVKFIAADGKPKDSSPFPSAVVIWRPRKNNYCGGPPQIVKSLDRLVHTIPYLICSYDAKKIYIWPT